MSKITPKNLQYNSDLPPFLARLHANNTSRDGRQEFSVARPKKARTAEDEAEDEPVYFDEQTGDSLTKSEWEEREGIESGEKSETVDVPKDGEEKVGGELQEERTEKEKEKLAAIGASKKRKAGKVIGAEDEEAESKGDSGPAGVGGNEVRKPEATKLEKGKSAKKGKKIKLSFGDDD